MEHPLAVRRLIWAGPTTVAAAIAAVSLIQVAVVSLMAEPPEPLVESLEPAIVTTILVSVAVVVFAMVAHEASRPVRTFQRIAAIALVLSCLPDVAVGYGVIRGEGWTLAAIFTAMHVAAWAVTVVLLPRLARAPTTPVG